MPRPVWTGSISFGLVNVPIKLFSATESHRVAFHEFEEGTGARVRYKRVAEGSGREVPWEKIQKGFEVGKDRFVVLTNDELDAAAPARTHTVDIEQFVSMTQIDPVAWDQTYYAAPDGVAATKAYVLLRDAMRKDGRVAVGRFVMRTKESLVCLRPLEDALALHTMFFGDEVRSVKDVVQLPRHTAARAAELALAARLIESLSGSWDPRRYEDTYRKSILVVVKKKDRGETIEAGASTERPKIVDLMEALKKTLETPRSVAKPAPRQKDPRSKGASRARSAPRRVTRPARTPTRAALPRGRR
jgi:DNA end-binding protein Ku